MFDRSRKDAGGASAVEFALLLPVLIVLLFGIMFGASVFNTQQTVTQAAREAARFGATLPFNAVCSDNAAPCPAWFAAIQARALDVTSNDSPLTFAGEDPTICVAFGEAGAPVTNGFCQGNPFAGLAGDDPKVRVIVSRPARIELVVAPSPEFTLRASGLARYEGAIDD